MKEKIANSGRFLQFPVASRISACAAASWRLRWNISAPVSEESKSELGWGEEKLEDIATAPDAPQVPAFNTWTNLWSPTTN